MNSGMNDLTPDQQTAVQEQFNTEALIQQVLNLDTNIRATILRSRDAIAGMKACVADYNNGLKDLINALPANTLLPTTTGLAGATNVTREVYINLCEVQFPTLIATWDDPTTVLPVHTKLVGGINLYGQA